MSSFFISTQRALVLEELIKVKSTFMPIRRGSKVAFELNKSKTVF